MSSTEQYKFTHIIIRFNLVLMASVDIKMVMDSKSL